MKLARSFVAIALCFSLVSISSLTLAVTEAAAQDSKIALQRGYRTGYSDGYMSGYRDAIDNSSRSYSRHDEYKKADRAFSNDYGSLTDYQDGYRQGFENGYDKGFEKLSFDATIPTDLKFRGAMAVEAAPEKKIETTKPEVTVPAVIPDEDLVAASVPTGQADSDSADYVDPILDDRDDAPQYVPADLNSGNKAPNLTTAKSAQQSAISGNEIIIIPADTELVIELLDEIDTKTVREGDPFKARIVSPREIGGAIIEGRIAKNRKPGRLKRRAELILSFDRIVLSQSRWSNFNAIIMEVLPIKGDNIKRVDDEGTVEGQRPYKSDATKIGASTGTGVVIGAIVGGPVGAAVGAGVGAAFGVGAVVVERGKYIRLLEQQQMRIKTAYETQIR